MISNPTGADTNGAGDDRLRDGLLLDRVCTSIAQLLAIDLEVISRDRTLLELGAQSLDFLQLVFRLEEAFGIELPMEFAIAEPHTVQSYVNAVSAALAGRP